VIKVMYTIILVFILCFAGCSSQTKQEEEIQPKEQEVPKATEEPIKQEEKEPVLLGQAQTDIIDQDEDRIHNISLASQNLNGYVLKSNEVFSFNEVLGDRTEEKGYRDAAVIVKGKKEEDCGGGVCQVSTTLYQAAQNAGMTILERNSHQKEVPYAAQGEDAAVNYGSLDLRFKNNLGVPVVFELYIENGTMIANIFEQ